jgi:hypothetical protein
MEQLVELKKIGSRNRSIRRKFAQIQEEQTWERTRAAAVRRRRLTA